jgi:uncharacterized protein HemX
MNARIGFWLALLVAGFGAGLWLMWGQVGDARARAAAAKDQVLELRGVVDGYAKVIEQVQQRQQQTDESLATRAVQDTTMQAQLSQLRADLKEVMTSDPESKEWGAQPVPGAVAERLWGPAKPAAGGAADRAGAAAGKPAGRSAGAGASKP